MLVMTRIRKAPPRFVSVGQQPSNVDWKALHRIADVHYPAMMQAFLDAVEAMRDTLSQEELVAVLARGPDAAWSRLALAWENAGRPALEAAWIPEMQTILQASAAATQATLLPLVPPPFQATLPALFFQVNESAVLHARRLAGSRIQGITDTTLHGVREILTRAFAEGRTPDQTARALAHTVGLTPGHVSQLVNYQQGLWAQNVPFPRQERLMRARARRLLRQRGEVIARTETINTSNAGQQALWEQAQGQGFLPATLRRFWLVTPDDRLCTTCRAIPGMNVEGVGIHEPFLFSGGAALHPPAHPDCRCAQTLREGPIHASP